MAVASVADLLVDIGAVGVGVTGQYRFTSGLPSPMYCDNRVFLSHPTEREAMLEQLYARITEVTGVAWDAVAGVATAGIPFAAWVAMHFRNPMVYIRPTEKEHGKKNRIEGGLQQGARVILVEDLITTGGSALSAISVLREAGFVCKNCFSIFDYGFQKSRSAFESEGVEHSTLTRLDQLLQALRGRDRISDEDVMRVEAWRDEIDTGELAVPA